MDKSLKQKLKKHLDIIYENNYPQEILEDIVDNIDNTTPELPAGEEIWNEQDIILITYGDSIIKNKTPGLKTLKSFLTAYLKNEITIVHILPFFPYSSDDGFSVIDFYQVNPDLGDWKSITDIASDFDLMFDLVLNHISGESTWFKNYRKGKNPGKEYFIEADPKTDLSKVVRPRSLPLLTKVKTFEGEKYVWTTFSDDQIDLNYANPHLLIEMINIFLFYLQQGARIIRLDAIAFLWKEIGTNCLHLPQTHEVVKLFRTIAEYINPRIIILTETNVPNKENLSYFGNNDEANMVYQFSLPPLLLHALHTGNTKYLNEWASTIPEQNAQCTYFNFTASHDGIGVRPLEGLIPADEFRDLLHDMKKYGGKISTKTNSNGSESPYEINITYLDALKGTDKGKDELNIERFICSQTIMMSLKGIPAFYIHSLLATSNYYKGVKKTGRARTINRKQLKKKKLDKLLTKESVHKRVLEELKRRIEIRKTNKAFHPDANQKILDAGNKVFAVYRFSDESDNHILSVSNLSGTSLILNITDLLEEMDYGIDCLCKDENIDLESIELLPYQTRWIKKSRHSPA